MNQFDDISDFYERLVLGFIMFNCNEYSRCCLLHLIHLTHWEEKVPELYNKIITNYTILDEEPGEISLSILASQTLSKPIQSDISLFQNIIYYKIMKEKLLEKLIIINVIEQKL